MLFFSRQFSLKNLFYNQSLYNIMNRKEAFEILELTEKSPPRATIRKNYYAMALKLHPDRGGDEEKFKKLNEAYTLLTKPSIRSRSSISSISRSMSRSSSRKNQGLVKEESLGEHKNGKLANVIKSVHRSLCSAPSMYIICVVYSSTNDTSILHRRRP